MSSLQGYLLKIIDIIMLMEFFSYFRMSYLHFMVFNYIVLLTLCHLEIEKVAIPQINELGCKTFMGY